VNAPGIERLAAGLRRLGFVQRDWYLIVLGAAIGTVTAFGAIAFKKVLDLTAEWAFETHEHLPWWSLPLVPMAGAFLTAVIVWKFASEAKGHGVPEVIDAVHRRGGRIRLRVALAKAIASITTIGSGGSAGAEGPIVQIGSSIGSAVAQWLHIPREHVATLLGCGAAAGIASVFNAPIAGVFFVLEILLRDFTAKTFTPVLIASVFSAATTQAVLDDSEAIFAVSEQLRGYEFSFPELPSYLVLGVVCGFVAVGFVRLLYFTEDLFDGLKVAGKRIPYLVKPVIGAALLGLLGLGFVGLANATDRDAEIPNFFGNGYETIRVLLDPAHFDATTTADQQPSQSHVTDASPSPPPSAAPRFDSDAHSGPPPIGADAEPGPTPQHEANPRPLPAPSTDAVAVEPNQHHAGLIDLAHDEERFAQRMHMPTEIWLLSLLLLCKALATCFTLGSGGSGGVFAPSLFLGATTGAVVGSALYALALIPAGGSPAAYALVGMAAVVAATTHAPLTAILVLFELTNDYKVILPIMLAAVVATSIAQLVLRDSIYSLKLRRRGLTLGSAVDYSLLRKLTARDITTVPHVVVRPSEPLSKLLELRDAYRIVDFVVLDSENRYAGMVTGQDLRTALIEREAIPYLLVAELIRQDLPTIHPDETLDAVLRKFSECDVSSLALVEQPDTPPAAGAPNKPGKVLGLITRGRLMRRYNDALTER